jgi:hypothetical protein
MGGREEGVTGWRSSTGRRDRPARGLVWLWGEAFSVGITEDAGVGDVEEMVAHGSCRLLTHPCGWAF